MTRKTEKITKTKKRPNTPGQVDTRRVMKTLVKALPHFMFVYICLAGIFTARMQQKDIVKQFKLSASTVSDNVKMLCQKQYLVKTWTGNERWYSKGKMHLVLEECIRAKLQGIDIAIGLGVVGGWESQLVRTHNNGGWQNIIVRNEGRIESFFYPKQFKIDSLDLLDAPKLGPFKYDLEKLEKKINKKRSKDNQIHLLENTLMKPTKGLMKGRISQYAGSFGFNGRLVKIQYHVTTKGTRVLRICIGDVLQPVAKAIEQSQTGKNPYYDDIASFLIVLEKYAGWEFEKNLDGSFALQYNGKGNEYGLNKEVSDVIHDVCPNLGIPGKTPIWFDRSAGSLGSHGEAETNKLSLAQSIYRLPDTTSDVDWVVKKTIDLEERVDRIEGKGGTKR